MSFNVTKRASSYSGKTLVQIICVLIYAQVLAILPANVVLEVGISLEECIPFDKGRDLCCVVYPFVLGNITDLDLNPSLYYEG